MREDRYQQSMPLWNGCDNLQRCVGLDALCSQLVLRVRNQGLYLVRGQPGVSQHQVTGATQPVDAIALLVFTNALGFELRRPRTAGYLVEDLFDLCD